jgi:hypothetical protein
MGATSVLRCEAEDDGRERSERDSLGEVPVPRTSSGARKRTDRSTCEGACTTWASASLAGALIALSAVLMLRPERAVAIGGPTVTDSTFDASGAAGPPAGRPHDFCVCLSGGTNVDARVSPKAPHRRIRPRPAWPIRHRGLPCALGGANAAHLARRLDVRAGERGGARAVPLHLERIAGLAGNAAAGALGELFEFDITTAIITCDGCSRASPVGALPLYGQGMGTVLRCPGCDHVLIVVTRPHGEWCLDLRGVRLIRICTLV